MGGGQLSLEGACTMAKAAASPILRLLHRVIEDTSARALPDPDLVQRFHTQQDQAAFQTLLGRHGPMVLGICRGVLGDGPDAEDTFQATFLVLAQKAGSIRKGTSLGSWLHGVAHRTALKARAQSAVRHKHEARAPQRQASEANDLSWREVREVLHEELGGIPERFREPLVMCYLEGVTQERAAARLGLAERTVRERLERGRALLRRRLVRRGLGPAAILAVAAWPNASVSAAVPAFLLDATVKAVANGAAGGAATLVVSAEVAALTREVLRTMFLNKLFTAMAGLLIAGLLAGAVLIPGLDALRQASLAQQPAVQPQDKPPDGPPAQKAADAGQDSVKVTKPGKWVESLAYCNDGKTVAIVLWNGAPRADTQAGAVVLWDLEKGKVQQTLAEFDKFDEDTLQFWHVAAARNGTIIAASATAGKVHFGAIRVWEARTGRVLQTFEFAAQVQGAVAVSADGTKVAGGDCITVNGEVCVWDVASGNLLHKLATPKMDNWSLAFSDNGKWIAAGGWAGDDGLNRKNHVMVWDLVTGKVQHEWTDPDMGGSVVAVAFSPDGKLLAAGGAEDRSIRVWDMQTGKLKHLLTGHEIKSLAFAADGNTLASAGMDGKIVLWDVAKEKARVTLQGHDKDDQGRGPWALGVVFAPDGRTLASGGSDGTVRFWRLAAAAPPKK
jgi:RNA polymerase sigma factor (sigma-70 family)